MDSSDRPKITDFVLLNSTKVKTETEKVSKKVNTIKKEKVMSDQSKSKKKVDFDKLRKIPENNIKTQELNNESEANQDDNMEIEKTENIKYGIGLDVGTGFLVGASYSSSQADKLKYRIIRDAFIQIDRNKFNPSLFNEDVKYIEFDDSIFIVGENAIEFARTMNTAAKRPLANGIVNPEEREYSTTILQELFSFVVEKHIKKDGEKLFFSIPGPQITNPGFDTTFHTMSIQSLCNSFGVNSEPLNEAYAVGISELGASRNLTSLNFSFGAGLVNVCLAYKGLSLFEFCIDKSGDFIDQTVAKGCGEETAYVCKIKEQDLDLTLDDRQQNTDIKRHLYLIYKFIIKNTLNEVVKAFKMTSGVKVNEAIPIVISGGTSMPKGFIDLFKETLDSVKLPFGITEIVHAQDPLRSVAKGCCMWANSMEN